MRQTAVGKAQLTTKARGIWEITDIGLSILNNATPGLVVTVFETGMGKALWATIESALGAVADNSVDLVLTSPPYPCAGKAYLNGSLDEADWVSFLFDAITGLGPKLTETGSMILNIAEMYEPGRPVKMEHISRLRLRLADETSFRVLDTLHWHNTARLPVPVEWVAKRRVRLSPSVEQLLWLSTNPFAKADNRAVLRPYGPKMRAHLDGTKPHGPTASRHAGGHRFSRNAFARDNGGSIAPHLISIGACGAPRVYYKEARAEGFPIHPAPMPAGVAEFCIKLTTDPGDLVFDPFGGTLTTGAAAEKLRRRWVSSDISLSYLAGARHRFPERKEDTALIEAARRSAAASCGR